MFPMQWTCEGGEVSELGAAHLHEENLDALTWEKQVPNIKNTIFEYDKIYMVNKLK